MCGRTWRLLRHRCPPRHSPPFHRHHPPPPTYYLPPQGEGYVTKTQESACLFQVQVNGLCTPRTLSYPRTCWDANQETIGVPAAAQPVMIGCCQNPWCWPIVRVKMHRVSFEMSSRGNSQNLAWETVSIPSTSFLPSHKVRTLEAYLKLKLFCSFAHLRKVTQKR